jgi:hypothetical protein
MKESQWPTRLEMENDNSITLRKGSTSRSSGMSDFGSDADEIRFAPVVKRTGSYELRGTVIIPSKTSEFTWTPHNFEDSTTTSTTCRNRGSSGKSAVALDRRRI